MAGTRRKDEARQAALEARIREAVGDIPSLLRLDDALIELREFQPESGMAVLQVSGECPHCQLSVATFLTGVEAHLRRAVPEVRVVRLADEPNS
jgi:Fe-S cluster biogenesis protein NfuA